MESVTNLLWVTHHHHTPAGPRGPSKGSGGVRGLMGGSQLLFILPLVKQTSRKRSLHNKRVKTTQAWGVPSV